MKTLILIIVSVLFNFNLINDKLDEANGFEIYKLGTSPANYKNLTIELDESNTKLYSADNDAVKIQGVKLSFIRITFTNNRLSAITAATINSSGPALLNYLTGKYGTPVKVKGFYEWKGQKVKLLYESLNNGKEASVSFYSI